MGTRGPSHLWLWLSRISLASLVICLASGALLLFQYKPVGDVFQSVERITARVPYGFFLRRMHYYSGQAFTVLVLLHLLEQFWRRTYAYMKPAQWARLCAGAWLGFFMLFTGFVLKADQEGFFAASIMQNLLRETPLTSPLANVMVGSGKSFYLPPYLWHCFFGPLLLAWLLRGHLRDWRPAWGPAALALLMSGGLSLWLPLPPAHVAGGQATEVGGPWFFLGLQWLLRYLPAWLAGLALPVVGTGLFLTLPVLPIPRRGFVHWMLLACLAAYAALCVWFFRGPGG